jgi:hypothetical protein
LDEQREHAGTARPVPLAAAMRKYAAAGFIDMSENALSQTCPLG